MDERLEKFYELLQNYVDEVIDDVLSSEQASLMSPYYKDEHELAMKSTKEELTKFFVQNLEGQNEN